MVQRWCGILRCDTLIWDLLILRRTVIWQIKCAFDSESTHSCSPRTSVTAVTAVTGHRLPDYSRTKSLYPLMTGLHIIMMTDWWQSRSAWGPASRIVVGGGSSKVPAASSHFKTIFRHRSRRSRHGKIKILATNKVWIEKQSQPGWFLYFGSYTCCTYYRPGKLSKTKQL